MQTLALIGSQWGDEGKGKITDVLSKKCDLTVRYQGGNNAGHTIIVGDKKVVLHLIPSGILHDHGTSVIGHGMVVDPWALLEELETLKKANINVGPSNLMISENCVVITSYNKILDNLREGTTEVKIGTTGKGIGPSYEDKIARRAIKMRDLFSKENLKKKLLHNIKEKEILFKHLFNCELPDIDQETEKLFQLGQKIKPFVRDTFSFIDKSLQQGKKILYEGAQGILLDIDYGSYPFVTSSNTSLGGIYTGSGVPSGKIDEVLGITKAYTTRVGEGPFPTELDDEIGVELQTRGNEFGATTGRKRRCGWLDLPLLKYAVKASGLTSIALTKIDVLAGMSELKVCYGYKYNGEVIDCAYPGIDLSQATPVYKNIALFNDDFKKESVSKNLQDYISEIESFLEIPVGILAFGPERRQISFKKDYF